MSSDEADFEEVTTLDHPHQHSVSAPAAPEGGFLVDDDVPMGGGFLPEEDTEMEVSYAGGGGFLPEDAQDVDYGPGGGFLPDDSTGGGGVIPEASSWNGSFTGGGGFLPEDDELVLEETAQSARTSRKQRARSQSQSAGGFFPETNYNASAQLGTERIGLSAIPAALAALPWELPVPADSPDLLALFEEIASDDDLLGEPSVRRDRFDEACRDLRGSDGEDNDEQQQDDDDDGDEPVRPVGRRAQPGRKARPRVSFEAQEMSGDDDEEDFVPDEAPKKGGRPPRRATRNADPPELDSGLSSGPSSDEYADNDSDAGKKDKKSKAASSKKGKAGSKGKAATKRSERPLTERQVAGAQDTFDLFFEGSAQTGPGRMIRLEELRRVSALLNEKLSDLEMKEMLEYALSGAGTGAVGGLDLKAFAGLLAEVD